MYRLLSYAERDTLFSDTVFRIRFSDVILFFIERYGFAVISVDLNSSSVNNLWAAFVTPFADSFLQPGIKTKADQPWVSGESLFQHAKKKSDRCSENKIIYVIYYLLLEIIEYILGFKHVKSEM